MHYARFMESIDLLKKISKIISIIINPLLVAPLSFAIIIYLDDSLEMKHIFFFISVLFTNILPLITIYYFIRLGKVSSFDAPIKEQRIELLAIAAIYNAVAFIFLWYMGAPPIVTGLMFCYAVNTAIVWRITMAWKISIHMIGLGGPIVALWLAGHEYHLFMGSILVTVGASRLFLKAHTFSQIIVGMILAMGLSYFELTYLFL